MGTMVAPPRKQATQPEMAADDGDLLEAVAKQGDRQAFELLVARYRQPAYSLAYYLTHNREEAYDVVQDAMLKVWLSANTFTPGNARGWIMRIVGNEAMRRIRSRVRAKNLEQQQSGDERTEEAPDRQAQTQELLTALKSALKRLPQTQSVMLTLYYGAEMSQKDIGVALEMPQQVVSAKLSKALDALRGLLRNSGHALAVAPLTLALGEAVTSGQQPPPGLEEGIAQSLHALGEAHQSARLAAAGMGPKIALMILGLVTLSGGGAALWATYPNGTEIPVAAQESQADADESQTKPPAGVHVQAQSIDRSWAFDENGKSDLRVVRGEWTWMKDRKGRGVMIVPRRVEGPAGGVFLEFPMDFPAQPFEVSIWVLGHTEQLESKIRKKMKVRFNLGAIWWYSDLGIVPHTLWQSDLNTILIEDITSRFDIRFFNNCSVMLINGEIYRIRQFPDAYPSKKVSLSMGNLVVDKIETRLLPPDEPIPTWEELEQMIQERGLVGQEQPNFGKEP